MVMFFCDDSSYETLRQQRPDDLRQLVVFQKEAVVAEFGSDFMISRTRYAGGNMLLLLHGEQSVTVNTDHHAV